MLGLLSPSLGASSMCALLSNNLGRVSVAGLFLGAVGLEGNV